MQEGTMARTSRQEWAERIERWSDSGLTAREFATEIGVNPRTLMHWKWVLKPKPEEATVKAETPGSAAAPELRFVELAGDAVSSESFEIVLGSGMTLRVPARFDADALSRLLDVLGQRP
jgi:hypothetical protein